jgi:tetratricopeptide (TPR) repeat protein
MMKKLSIKSWAPAALMSAITFFPASGLAAEAPQNTSQSATQTLLEKAHTLEARGRMDMASQTWQQVLLVDPNNVEALGGLARAAKLSGDSAKVTLYLDRLRAINPSDPMIARVQGMGTQQNQSAQLAQAGKLAQAGQYTQAMSIYRQVFGNNPPPGDWALAYYETESATDEGRSHAIAGLHALAERYPSDSRYQVALGRVLTYNPKTRPEGRKLLERYPNDAQAVEALRQSLLWDAQSPTSASDIRAYLARHPDAQLAQALKNQPPAPRPRVPQTPEEAAALEANRARSIEEQAAFKALNAHHLEEAEMRFKAILATRPESGSALAGMGYVRMQQSNFGGAISFLEQAKQFGSSDPGLETALATSRFWYTMGEGEAALNNNDLATAEKQYRAALAMRPTSPEALEGLGGTLLKAQQDEPAAQIYDRFTRLKPASASAWRGLFLAQFGAGNAAGALLTERRIPPAVHAQLLRDPDFLRTLASAYSAVGRDADAQQVLRGALDLPFPAGGEGLHAETQLQYASLLQQANHLDQAGGLYRQVLANDPENAAAWQGLVRVEHAMSQDPQAVQTIESMPPDVYATVMRDPGFETTVAAIYQSQGKLDIAQDLLEKAIAQQTTSGQKVSVPVQLQLAAIYLQRNNPQLAYPIYQRVLSQNPDRLDAWKGLLSALHTNNRDQEALAEVQQIPAAVRTQLENDPEYLQTVGAVYNALGQPRQAGVFLARIQRIYTMRHTAPPADIDIQDAWLLFNSGNDVGLYRQLMNLGSRTDLTDEQRRTVQTQWAAWAVRRANQVAAAGDNKRSLAILNAAAHSFPDNPGVIKALAGGYARAGLPKQAVAIFKAQDMTHTTASDYKAAVGAALAAGDTKDAETWLRYGLDAYPRDAQMLGLAARFEQARGDNSRAATYYRASLAAMPPPDPGAELADELSRPVPASNIHLPSATQSQDLASLLAPGAQNAATPQPAAPSTYLPSYANSYGNAPVQLNGTPAPAVPSYMGNPATQPTQTPSRGMTLRDYVPEAANHRPDTLDDFVLPTPPRNQVSAAPQSPSSTRVYNDSAPAYAPSPQYGEARPRSSYPQTQPRRGTRLTAQPQSELEAQSQSLPLPQAQPAPEVYGPYVPYVPPAQRAIPVQLGENSTRVALPQPEVTDVTPTARYVPNARTNATATRPELAAARAAAIRRNQSNPVMTGQSNPPADDSYATPDTQNAQYNPAQSQAAQIARPTTRSQLPDTLPTQTGDSESQQYPRPRRTTTPPRRTAHKVAPPIPTAAPRAPQLPAMSYPAVPQPLSAQSFPATGQPYAMPAAPTDADLVAKSVPPLRGGYNPNAQVPLDSTHPLTEREQAERDLATLEASYSGWVGGTGFARYRSGVAGIDRMTDLEAPIELSAVLDKNVRASVVARPVFLNSGVIDVAAYSGVTGTVPVLGTFPANALVAPAQQFSSGVGGEGQLVTTNFGVAVGYTPYEFLVRNITGRLRWRPGGSHFTFLIDRDSVKETQLSYAGLRDPGSATPVFAGNIWGGVVSTGAGIRFDAGNEKSGLYLSGGGASLNGYHVLDNKTFNGSAGAYFRVKSWPQYGTLNIGGSLYGAHFDHNERGLTYGFGGYFSPNVYFLASVPVTFAGHYKSDWHYLISGSVGLQTFQEDSAPYYPLDPATETGALSGCTLAQITARTCGYLPVNSNTGANYGVNAEASYRIVDHWFVGAFLSGNNTNNYNTVSGGAFIRYLFRPQIPSENYPTGLFPTDGFRPLRVP